MQPVNCFRDFCAVFYSYHMERRQKTCVSYWTPIRKLLVDRQSKPAAAQTIKQEVPQSNADELKKFKELLDMGIITQEEFDAKKKQLLGL